MKKLLQLKPLKKESISQKLVISFTLMSIIPILLALYIIYTMAGPALRESMGKVRWVIFLMISAACAGYWMSKRIVRSVLGVVRNSKAVASGDLSCRVETAEEDEISELSDYFNRLTRRLKKNIKDLKESKKLLQDVLSRVGAAVTSFQDIDSLLELVVQTMTNALSGESGCLMLVDPDKDELFIKVAFGLDKDFVRKARVKIGRGVCGWVAKENKPIRLPGPEGAKFNLKSEHAYRSLLCVPLFYTDKVIGTLSVNDKATGEFTQDDLILLSNLAIQTAIAIENARLNESVEKTYFETITALAMAVEAKDPYTRGHSKRVAEYSTKLAKKFGFSDEKIEVLKEAAVLHDIGKIGISDVILHKPGPLTLEEYELVQEHTVIGEHILKPVRRLSSLCDIVRHHQEWVNGHGYPDGLKGEELSLPVRILTVADAYDAMISDRPYRKALTKKEAEEELKRYSGTHFDPKVVEEFLKLI